MLTAVVTDVHLGLYHRNQGQGIGPIKASLGTEDPEMSQQFNSLDVDPFFRNGGRTLDAAMH